MKSIVIVLAFIFSILNYYAQIPSSCEGEESIEASYRLDAEILALEHIYENDLTFVDSVNIPEDITASIQGALMAVYNVVGIPERDSVTSIYDIHTFPFYPLNAVLLAADSTLSWMQELSDNVFPTSEPLLNDLMITYEMSVINVYTLGSSFLVEFETEQNYNIIALAELFEDIPDISFSEPNGYVGDGNDIEVSMTESYIELDYSLGWGDCPAGCICRRHWVFRVFPDCSVEFVNSFGCSIEPVGIGEINHTSFNVFPNPFEDYILLEDVKNGSPFTITNQIGQTILEGNVQNNTILHLDRITSGIYFLNIINDKDNQTVKIVKK